MTASANLTIRAGDTWSSPVWAVLVNKAPVNLADGWTVRAHARRRPRDLTALAQWTNADASIEIGQATVTLAGGDPQVTSTVRLRTPAATSAGWDPWHGVFDVEVSKDGQVYTIVTGTVRVIADVTR